MNAASSGALPPESTTERKLRARPVLFVIDDDVGVMQALRDDLGRRFSEDFRVIGESSAAAGLAALRRLADEYQQVALLIADHGMSEMPGTEFLARAHKMHPLAKRVLLVERDYSARSPIVQAMMLGQADYHLTKPWALEQDLYREISGFLAEWAKDQHVGFDLFQVIGGLHDRDTHELQELLTRFNEPFRFHDADSELGRLLLKGKNLDASRLPVVIRHDGYTMVRPTPTQVIEATGGTVSSDISECDVAIVGAGPAGLTAAVYAASEGLQTVVLEETVSGGQAGSSPMIRNYPGFPHGISGHDLTRRACEQAWMFGAHMVSPSVRSAWTTGAASRSCSSPAAAKSPPAQSSWRPASPGGAWACRAWRHWSAPGSSTARPGARRGPCKAATSTSWAPGTRPARPRCTWDATLARSRCSCAGTAWRTRCRTT